MFGVGELRSVLLYTEEMKSVPCFILSIPLSLYIADQLINYIPL